MTTDRSGALDLPLVLQDLERAVNLGEQLGLRDELTQARDVLAQASHRRRLAPETTVAALLGATGSGKSSLANALTGSEVSRTARTRPTTTQPLAVVPDTAVEAAELLDWLAVGHRSRVDGGWALGETTVLVDLPDIDSDEPAHRASIRRSTPTASFIATSSFPWRRMPRSWWSPSTRWIGSTLRAGTQCLGT